jgi:hypothetical protein
MRAIALATTIAIVLSMSVTPAPAADRTAQPLEEDRTGFTLSKWIDKIERALVGYVVPTPVVPTLWTAVIQPAVRDEPTSSTDQTVVDNGPASVILEDGAPF